MKRQVKMEVEEAFYPHSEPTVSNVRPIHIKEVNTSWIEKIHKLKQKKSKVPSKIPRDASKSKKENINDNKVKTIPTINENHIEGEI